jgi:hypothetical protein
MWKGVALVLGWLLVGCVTAEPPVAVSTPGVSDGHVEFWFRWPAGRAVVTQVRTLVGTGEDSKMTIKWALDVTRDADTIVVRSHDYELLGVEGSHGKFQIVDARQVLGQLHVDAEGEILAIDELAELAEFTRSIERARHPQSDDEGAEFRARMLVAIAGPEQLETLVRGSWDALVGNVAGKRFPLGRGEGTRSSKMAAYGGGVRVETVVEFTIDVDVECGVGRPATCARIHKRTQAADPKAAGQAIAAALDKGSGGGNEYAVGLADAQLVGNWESELVCDPATLRPYSWGQVEETGVVSSTGERTVNVSLLETRFDWLE